MAEYVDITKLKERIRYDFDYSLQLCEDIIEVTDSLPTIEIVHCSECVHYGRKPYETTTWTCEGQRDDGFCSSGERKK